MQNRKANFLRGMRDGAPIGLGYFAVSFALGIKAAVASITPFEAGLMSLLNLTSGGEAAAIALLTVGTTYVELAFTQLVINIRYLLMSCSLSQKIAPETSLLHRFLIGYGVTDEIFGISMSTQGRLSPYYSYGAIAVAAPSWTLGTVLGVLMGDLMPPSAVSALSVALYAMFLAIILPPARKSAVIAGVVGCSMLASALLAYLCSAFSLTWFSEGFRIVFLTVVISAIFAILFPLKDGAEETNDG